MKNFWDFCAPFYDLAERTNNSYRLMVYAIRELIPQRASVMECAAGTGAISLAVSEKASLVLCTDLSDKMLKIAERKAKKLKVTNILFAKRSIYSTNEQDNAFDVVIASQVFHLLDEPENAAAELKRITHKNVIIPICLLKDLQGFSKFTVSFYRMLGFTPKREFDLSGYKRFLNDIGFKDCSIKVIPGRMPMAVAVYSHS